MTRTWRLDKLRGQRSRVAYVAQIWIVIGVKTKVGNIDSLQSSVNLFGNALWQVEAALCPHMHSLATRKESLKPVKFLPKADWNP